MSSYTHYPDPLKNYFQQTQLWPKSEEQKVYLRALTIQAKWFPFQHLDTTVPHLGCMHEGNLVKYSGRGLAMFCLLFSLFSFCIIIILSSDLGAGYTYELTL